MFNLRHIHDSVELLVRFNLHHFFNHQLESLIHQTFLSPSSVSDNIKGWASGLLHLQRTLFTPQVRFSWAFYLLFLSSLWHNDLVLWWLVYWSPWTSLEFCLRSGNRLLSTTEIIIRKNKKFPVNSIIKKLKKHFLNINNNNFRHHSN